MFHILMVLEELEAQMSTLHSTCNFNCQSLCTQLTDCAQTEEVMWSFNLFTLNVHDTSTPVAIDAGMQKTKKAQTHFKHAKNAALSYSYVTTLSH